MSFGWSAGDVVAAINLVNTIVKSVSSVGGAREHFQELESELGGLLRALNEISQLASLPGQIPEIVALKYAACLCEGTLERFYEKIKPFDAALGASSRTSKLKAAPRMVRWELLVKKDIPEFRSYLVAHVGALNLRLNTAAIEIASRSLIASNESHTRHQQSSEAIQDQLQIRSQAIVAKLDSISAGDTILNLTSLLTTATNVWKAQSNMMDMFAKAVESLPPPDLRHTWQQTPVKFEDALGRIIPVPSEYDWDKLEAIIQAQFKTGPGHAKVRSGEYELFSGLDEVNAIKSSTFCPVPGMTITMAFIIGQYDGSQRCPRLGCKARSLAIDNATSGRVCTECLSWFRKSRALLPKPMKPPVMEEISAKRLRGADRGVIQNTITAYNDRKSYKNISIYITELPPTPAKFRDKYHRTRIPPKRPSEVSEAGSEVMEKLSNGSSPQLDLTRMKALRKYHMIYKRPQTNQFSAMSTISVPGRPHTIDFESDSPFLKPSNAKLPGVDAYYCAPNRSGLNLTAAARTKMEDDMRAARADEDFMDELNPVAEQWFKILSHGENTAVLYALLQQTTPMQISFFLDMLQSTLRNESNAK